MILLPAEKSRNINLGCSIFLIKGGKIKENEDEP